MQATDTEKTERGAKKKFVICKDCWMLPTCYRDLHINPFNYTICHKGCYVGVDDRQIVEAIHDNILSKEFPVTVMSTFLCEECCEAVQVITALLGKELRFKCPTCHQENHYDLTA